MDLGCFLNRELARDALVAAFDLLYDQLLSGQWCVSGPATKGKGEEGVKERPSLAGYSHIVPAQ